MADKKSFVLYKSWRPLLKKMTKEQKGELFEAIFDYQCGDEPVFEDNAVEIVFELFREKMDTDIEAYKKKCAQNAENRAGQGKNTTTVNEAPRPSTTVNDRQRDNDTDTETDTEKDKESLSEIKEKRRRFTPPTIEEVSAYCQERNNGVNPEHFIDFYTSKGWKVGNQTMKDWKASVRTWERRDREQGRASPQKFNPTQYLLNEIAKGGFD